jgi:S1-C subfamily serine protease
VLGWKGTGKARVFTMSLQLSFGLAVVIFGQLPTIEAEGFGDAVQRDTLLSTVRIINRKKDTLAVGVVLSHPGPIAYVLTAAHVVENADEVELHVFDAKSYPKASKIYKSVPVYASGKNRQPDLAVLKLVGFKGLPDGLKVCPVNGLPKDKKFAALASTCGDTLAPTLRQLTVQDAVRAKRPKEDRVGRYFQTVEKSVKGQSGGPLVNAKGQLMGICSGTTGENGYFCHIEEIHAFLSVNGLEFLVKDPP